MPATFNVLGNVDTNLVFTPAGTTITGAMVDVVGPALVLTRSDGAVVRIIGDGLTIAEDGAVWIPTGGEVRRIELIDGNAVGATLDLENALPFTAYLDGGFRAQAMGVGATFADTLRVTDGGTDIGATMTGSVTGDSITSAGGADRIFAGGGNDAIACFPGGDGESIFRRGSIDGGAGTDTLTIRAGSTPGDVVNLALTQIGGIEAINLAADATLILSGGQFGFAGLPFDLEMTTGTGSRLVVLAGFDGRVDLSRIVVDASASGTVASLRGRGEDADVLTTNLLFRSEILGRGGDDRLTGGRLADTLDGGAGADRMEGGAGWDRYVVDAAGDEVIERVGSGTDSVTAFADHALADFVENGAVAGGTNVDLTGNVLANRLTGDVSSNRIDGADGNDLVQGGGGFDELTGGAGRDTLEGNFGGDQSRGGLGNDRLTGGIGADRFVFADGFGSDVVTDFVPGDRINLVDSTLILSFADLVESHLATVGGNAVITAGAATITLTGVAAESLTSADFWF